MSSLGKLWAIPFELRFNALVFTLQGKLGVVQGESSFYQGLAVAVVIRKWS